MLTCGALMPYHNNAITADVDVAMSILAGAPAMRATCSCSHKGGSGPRVAWQHSHDPMDTCPGGGPRNEIADLWSKGSGEGHRDKPSLRLPGRHTGQVKVSQHPRQEKTLIQAPRDEEVRRHLRSGVMALASWYYQFLSGHAAIGSYP